MSTKKWIYRSETQYETTLFQEVSSNDDNLNTATLCIENPAKFSVSYSEKNNSSAMGHLKVEIPVSVLDDMAIAWCKQRKLQGGQLDKNGVLQMLTMNKFYQRSFSFNEVISNMDWDFIKNKTAPEALNKAFFEAGFCQQYWGQSKAHLHR
ncbi:hypothetical protein [Methylophaga nitratireducenticrescens]|nr:hypothetical protein [Methylophaga nitratireducenticrescens]